MVYGGVHAGPHEWTVKNRLLGTRSGELIAIGGEVSAQQLDWTQGAELGSPKQAYSTHRDDLAVWQKRRKSATAGRVGFATVTVGALGTATATAIGALSARKGSQNAADLYVDALDAGDIDDAGQLYQSRDDWRSTTNLRAGIAAGTAVLGGVGVVFTIRSFKRGGGGTEPTWDPETLVLPAPPAEAAPAEPPPAEEEEAPAEPTPAEQLTRRPRPCHAAMDRTGSSSPTRCAVPAPARSRCSAPGRARAPRHRTGR